MKKLNKNYKKAIKIEVKFNEKQLNMLPKMFGNSRFVYNYMLNLQQFIYKHQFNKNNKIKYLSKFDMNKIITKLKKKQKYSWLKLSDSTSLQSVSDNLNIAYQNFFKHRAKFPRFKKRSYNESYTSKCVANNIKIISEHFLKLPKLGLVQCKNIQKFHGKIKRATIQIKPTGKFFVVLIIDTKIDKIQSSNRKIGIDLGLRNFATLSNGLKVKSLRFNQYEHQLLIWQRKFAKRVQNAKDIEKRENYENSKRLIPMNVRHWYKHYRVITARQTIARIYNKITNIRQDFLHKLSTLLVNQYDEISIEDLKTKNLLKNHHLAKRMEQQGWRLFRDMLEYKCKWYDKSLKIVNPANTTQCCHNCGFLMNKDYQENHKIKLGVETWQCLNCSTVHDRDYNAAINILNAEPISK